MITRYSSHQRSLESFLPSLLVGARGYDRIAGYFRSSILEVAGEALETMAEGACVRIVCNSDLNPLDVQAASAAKRAMYREWRASLPEDITPALQQRLERLYRFLAGGRLRVRVLPDAYFGLVHGKAGVITSADGGKVAFIGSANESLRAWKTNYEIVWTDTSAEGVSWVQREFDALWTHPGAVDLAEVVVQDVARMAQRVVIPSVAIWRKQTSADPAAAAIELPIYSRENGLWAHQKYFIRMAFEQHKRGGARLILADQVGLGKTVQLALTAKLIALWEGGGRVVAFVPKTLLQQWQDELWTLLRLPSAVWTGRGWEDEHGVLHPEPGIDGLARCPRKLGIVSTGLLTQSGDALEVLASLTYACVILDEAHRARRRNLGATHRNEHADPNNLLRALWRLSARSTSMLLSTATPVQLDPIEAWDLLDALARRDYHVLGSSYSRWRTQPRKALAYVTGQEVPPQELAEVWEWMRDPLPPREEGRDFAVLRNSLRMSDTKVWANAETLEQMKPADRRLTQMLARRFFQQHHPFIRHIVRRTREFLETQINPETNEPYLKPVRVRLFGEDTDDAVPLPAFLRDAYTAAEDFCAEVSRRPGLSAGFLKTILLRRVGSTIVAGQQTAQAMLGPSRDSDDEEWDETPRSSLYPLLEAEREHLERFLRLLGAVGSQDPKYQVLEEILLHGVDGTKPWIEHGAIIFSQFYDSVFWAAGRLSARLPDEPIALYAGGAKSGMFRAGNFTRLDRDAIKQQVFQGALRVMFGTDAASEGLNLQKVGTLINLDLPWNPTRLEQRKGRIQRIGQVRDEVMIYNMRYRESVEDRVHALLSTRLRAVHELFGQLPDTLEDAWVAVALRDEQQALEIIDQVPPAHPFEIRYDRIEPVDWESCKEVLDSQSQLEPLLEGW